MSRNLEMKPQDITHLLPLIRQWSEQLGFQQIGVSGIDLAADEQHLLNWLKHHYHGEMDWLERHGTLRSRPQELVPGTIRVLSVRMDYLPPGGARAQQVLHTPERAYISRYALGRDYHKLIRRRLQTLARKIEAAVGEFGYRVFTDSAPVLEKALARNSGLGWIGKHTNLIHRRSGSWFFLGEIYTDLPLPKDTPEAGDYCGSCSACIDVCPTQAILGPRQLDARRCISYLTIELKGPIPTDLRPLIGNRVYGCDDCQLVCPWNKFARPSREGDFMPRQGLDSARLVDLFTWTEQQFLDRLQGSPIRRIGYRSWLRNLAVGLGNAPADSSIIHTLERRSSDPDPLISEHVHWALERQRQRLRRLSE